jgi:hypothetical protein
MISPLELRLAAIVLAVILGSNRVIATIVEMNTNIDVKKSVIVTWIM